MAKHNHGAFAHKHLTPSLMPPAQSKRIFIDLENEFGTGDLMSIDREDLFYGGLELLEDSGYAYGDQLYVATAHYNVPAIALAFPGRVAHMRSGEDGAETKLIELAELALARPERISEIVIGSGDNLMAGTAHKFRERGIPVTVLAPPRGLGAELRMAATTIRMLRPNFGLWSRRA